MPLNKNTIPNFVFFDQIPSNLVFFYLVNIFLKFFFTRFYYSLLGFTTVY